jgi:hypothetical protein
MRANYQFAREPNGQDRKAEMARTTRRHRLTRTGLALAILVSGSGLLIAHQVIKSNDRPQAIADKAALAGLQALVGADNSLDLSKFDAASTAAHRLAQNEGVAPAIVTPTADDSSFSVTLSAPGARRDVVATARYLRPGQTMSDALGRSRLARLSHDE